jgi:hypothetical protein
MNTHPLLRFWVKPFIVNVLFLLLWLPTLAKAGHQPEEDIQVFYKNPTYAKFLKATEYMSALSQEPHVNSLGVIFTMLALEKHKDFAPKLVKDFGGMQHDQQVLIYTGLVGAEYQKEMDEIRKKYSYEHLLKVSFKAKELEELQFSSSLKNLEALEQQVNIMDFLWSAFFATGDDKYLSKMIDYLAKNKDNIKLHWDETLPKDQQYQKIAIETLLWSIKSNCCQDPQIKKIILDLSRKYQLNDLSLMISATTCK